MFVIEYFGGFTTESLQSAHLVQMFNSTVSYYEWDCLFFDTGAGDSWQIAAEMHDNSLLTV